MPGWNGLGVSSPAKAGNLDDTKSFDFMGSTNEESGPEVCYRYHEFLYSGANASIDADLGWHLQGG
jgi:hypothetical protein